MYVLETAVTSEIPIGLIPLTSDVTGPPHQRGIDKCFGTFGELISASPGKAIKHSTIVAGFVALDDFDHKSLNKAKPKKQLINARHQECRVIFPASEKTKPEATQYMQPAPQP